MVEDGARVTRNGSPSFACNSRANSLRLSWVQSLIAPVLAPVKNANRLLNAAATCAPILNEASYSPAVS